MSSPRNINHEERLDRMSLTSIVSFYFTTEHRGRELQRWVSSFKKGQNISLKIFLKLNGKKNGEMLTGEHISTEHLLARTDSVKTNIKYSIASETNMVLLQLNKSS